MEMIPARVWTPASEVSSVTVRSWMRQVEAHLAERHGMAYTVYAISRLGNDESGWHLVYDARPTHEVSTDDDPLLTAAQVAELLGVQPAYVRRLIADGRIPSVKPGHDRLVRSSDVERHQQKRRPVGRPARNEGNL